MSIIDRLRSAHENSQQRIVGSNIFAEAADEIERLRAALKPFADYYEILRRNDRLGIQLISRSRVGEILGHAGIQEPELEAAWRALEPPSPSEPTEVTSRRER